jgi:very-short-patch-repair endonuclease
MGKQTAEAIDRWREKLLDLSPRNRLINCGEANRGAVKLAHPNIGTLWNLLVAEEKTLTAPWKRDLIGDEDKASHSAPPTPQDSGMQGDEGVFPPSQASLPLSAPSDIEPNHPLDHDFEACASSPELGECDILTRLSDEILDRRLDRLQDEARLSMSERGVPILFVAFGSLQWYESNDSEIIYRAPLLLVPAKLEKNGPVSRWQLSQEDEEIQPNYCLNQALLQRFRIEMPEFDEESMLDDPTGISSFLNRVREQIAGYPRWKVVDDVLLGTFAFQKVAMWKDLDANRESIAGHSICKALAGETDQSLGKSDGIPTAKTLDECTSPQSTFHILPCDSSQHEAIEAVKSGKSLVLDGPPGTGKSQTIANIIAESLAVGKTVLFVSEKSAALEVVKQRLDQVGLGDFCLECHSHKANRHEVIAELARCLQLKPEWYETDDPKHEELRRARQHLNAYVRALHQCRGALQWSAYHVHGLLAAMIAPPLSRCQIQAPLSVDQARLMEIKDAMAALVACAPVIESPNSHPWRNCLPTSRSLNLQDDVKHHFSRLSDLLFERLETFRGLQPLGLLKEKPSVQDLDGAVKLAREAVGFPTVPASWFGADPCAVANGYVALDAAVQEFRRIRATVDQFTDRTLSADWGRWMDRLKSSRSLTTRLAPGICGGVRSGSINLQLVLAEINRCAGALQATENTAKTILEYLRWPRDNQPTFPDLPKIIRIAECATEIGRIDRSWFEVARRQEMTRCAEDGKAEAAIVEKERAELRQVFGLVAFDTETYPLLVKSWEFNSIWKRFLPSWRRHRISLAALYQGPPPTKAKTLFKDLWRLVNHHQRVRSLQRLESTHFSEVRRDNQCMDWTAVSRDLALLDELEKTTAIPPALRDALADNMVNRDAIKSAATALDEKIEVFKSAWESLGKHFDLTAPLHDGKRPDERTLRDIGDWLETCRNEIAELRAVLTEIAAVVVDGQDVALAECEQASSAIAELREARCRVQDGFAKVQGVEVQIAVPEYADWHEKADKARWLLMFLDRHGNRPSEPLVAAACDATIRDKIKLVLGRIDALSVREFDEDWRFIQTIFNFGEDVSTGIVLERSPIEEIVPWLRDRIADVARMSEWNDFRTAAGRMENLGLRPLLDEVVSHKIPMDRPHDALLARFYRQWLDAAYREDASLGRFQLDDHERLIKRFRELDEYHIANNVKRVRTRCLDATSRQFAGDVSTSALSERRTLEREANRRRHRVSVRQFLTKIPVLLRHLKPCLMMSPLAVSTFLESNDRKFDLVIFDEASQIRPEDAICAIYRGKQLVVAGDPKQLPPTSFFERHGDEDAEDDEECPRLSDFENILDVCGTLGLPQRRLKWHYRSRRESLIAFSNSQFYDGELITFPSVHDAGGCAVMLDYVADGRWQGGSSGGFNAIEAGRVADLVIEHFKSGRNQSLGVVTMNQRQREQIREEIEKRRREHPEMEEFFRGDRTEPFFVKNIEMVQGDERDVIVLSVGYAPSPDGDLAMRFGPLNIAGGERRLNVAISRARWAITVVSSIRAGDIDLSRTKSKGAALLRTYLDFAERGMDALKSAISDDGSRQPDSPFEIAVARELEKRGFQVRRQVGCGRYWIDLALVHPKQPGCYVLGIECDGAMYHSSATARDRDRLRQSVLEKLGWRICRIWSTDWVLDPERQIQRVLASYEEAVRCSGNVTATGAGNGMSPTESALVRITSSNSGVEVAAGNYENIDDVPLGAIESIVQEMLEAGRRTDEESLIVSVARRLGFQRTGSRITHKVGKAIKNLIKRSLVIRDETGQISLCKLPGSPHRVSA